MVFKPGSIQDSGFKFDLQSVACSADQKLSATKSVNTSKAGMQDDLTARLTRFEKTYSERKATLLKTLSFEQDQNTRSQLVDSFIKQMDDQSLKVLKS